MKNLKIQILFVFVVALALFAGSTAHGQITPSDDAYTSSTNSSTNYGTAVTLSVSTSTTATTTGFIRFDLSSIPSTFTGTNIAQATLKLYVNTVTTAGSFNVNYVTGSWSEKTIKETTEPGIGATLVSNVNLATTNKGEYVLIDITPALVAWLDGTETNYGIALVGNSLLNATFDSKENTTSSHPPELDVVYAGGGGIAGVTTASGSGLMGGGSSGTLNLALTDSCAANQVLQWNGSSWTCAAVGTGTITGVTAGTDLTGGGASGNVTLNLDTTKVPSLTGTNVFTGNQTVNGNLSATGIVTGNSYQIGSSLFAFGSYATGNAFLGFSGNSTTTGTNNVAVGGTALLSNTTGSYNTASGSGALLFNSTGSSNTASGTSALSSNTTGGDNTAEGYEVLLNNSTGNYNSASGYEALISNTTGGDNAAYGSTALSYNTTGSWNTAVGSQAGNTSNAQPLTGSSNTFIGANSGPGTQTNLNNATAIGANAVVAESNAIVLGNGTLVGIGTSTPQYLLDVHGTGNFTGLVSFASGQTFPGTGSITGVTAGTGLTGGGSSGSVTLGLASNSCGSGNALTALPFSCSPFATTSANTFTGNQSVTGNVIASGAVTGSVITASSTVTGAVVDATASFSLGGSTFGLGSYSIHNAFMGFAGTAATTGTDNTGDGYLALQKTTGQYNTAIGSATLVQNTSGAENTATGTEALYNNTTANANSAFGYQALLYNTTGTNNTALGSQSGPDQNSPGLVFATAIGANAIVSASNAMALGAPGAVAGNNPGAVNVGIGSATPAYRLDVSYGDMIVRGVTPFNLSGEVSNLYVGDNVHGIHAVNGQGTYILSCCSPNALFVQDGGNVGIGTSSPTNRLTVAQGAGSAIADGWATYSSRRWKTNIHPLHNALTKVEQLRGVSYDLKDSGKHEIGVIAEEVGQVVPELVTFEKNGKDARGVDYSRLTALLIEAVKQQQRQIRD